MIFNFFGINFKLSKIFLGLMDSISIHKSLPILSTSRKSLMLTAKILAVNGFMIIGSYCFYHKTLNSLFEFENDRFNLSWIFYRSFWLIPICGLCYVISLVWYQELADTIIEEFYTQTEKNLTNDTIKKKKKKENSSIEHTLYDMISWLFFYIEVQIFLKVLPSIFSIADKFICTLIFERPYDLSFSGFVSDSSINLASDLVENKLFIDSSSSLFILLCNLVSVLILHFFNIFLPFLSFSLPFTSDKFNGFLTPLLSSSLSSFFTSFSSSADSSQIISYSSLLLKNNVSGSIGLIIIRQLLLIFVSILRLMLVFYSNFLLALLYSWYCFDLKWNTKKFSTKKKFTLIELNFNYFYGYGLPYVFIMSHFDFFISFGAYLMFFPFSIILGTINKYQRGKDDFLSIGDVDDAESESKPKGKRDEAEIRKEVEDLANQALKNNKKISSKAKIKNEKEKVEAKQRREKRMAKLENKINIFNTSQSITLMFIKAIMGKNKVKKD